MTPHQRAREIVARAMATQSPASGQWPTGALEHEITAALNDEIEACAKVAEIDCHHFFGQENCNACRTAAAIRSRKATR